MKRSHVLICVAAFVVMVLFAIWYQIATPKPQYDGIVYQLQEYSQSVNVEGLDFVIRHKDEIVCQRISREKAWGVGYDLVDCESTGLVYEGERWNVYALSFHGKAYIEVVSNDWIKPTPLAIFR